MSSDTYQEEDKKGKDEEKEEDDDEYYDSLDLKISSKFKLLPDSVDIILPLYNSNSLLLCNGTLYECNFKGEKYSKHPSNLSGVHQIALIESADDVLLLMEDRKEIKRISNKRLVTTFVRTDNVEQW